MKCTFCGDDVQEFATHLCKDDSTAPKRGHQEAFNPMPQVTSVLVDRFLQWPLPNSVCADLCATKQGPGRIGTNLLTATEAKQMLEFVIGPPLQPQESSIQDDYDWKSRPDGGPK